MNLIRVPGRTFASKPDTDPSVEETLNRLFEEKQVAEASGQGDAWYAGADQAASVVDQAAWEPTWYNLADQAILTIQNMHHYTGLEYGWSIVGVTIALRLGLFPLMVLSQQTASRMAHLQPELQMVKARYEALGQPSRQDQLQFSNQMKAIFKKYEVKPFRGFVAPLVQLPLFMGMFFGLRKMPDLFPEDLSTGGMYWFPDLTVTDPLYILPLASAISFLALIEAGKENMLAQNAATGQLMVNFFRVMSVGMIPVCLNFESAMLCYWTTNNFLTLGQTVLLQQPSVRGHLGIWERPKPVPGQEPESLKEATQKLMKTMRGEATTEAQDIARHNAKIDAKKQAQQIRHNRRNDKEE